jgi:response regulator RpfG family c-di-GMP phosphodiesterase
MAGINNRATPSGEHDSPGNGLSAQRTVLVVDDHDDSRSLLKTFLELSDFVVLEAENGESAIKLALTKHPDLTETDVPWWEPFVQQLKGQIVLWRSCP